MIYACTWTNTHHKITVAAGELLNSNIGKRLGGHLAGYNHAGITHHPIAVPHNEHRSSSRYIEKRKQLASVFQTKLKFLSHGEFSLTIIPLDR